MLTKEEAKKAFLAYADLKYLEPRQRLTRTVAEFLRGRSRDTLELAYYDQQLAEFAFCDTFGNKHDLSIRF